MENVRCPLCGIVCAWKDNPHRPFCSEACRDKDLGNWATERYKIKSEEGEESDTKPSSEDDGDKNSRG